jgi:predicted metal-dependent peptidase
MRGRAGARPARRTSLARASWFPRTCAARAQVRGRGGTVLQPGIDLLERSETFPKDGPILVITDGACDTLHLHRPHAFPVPAGKRLPFRAVGPVFELE